MAFREGELYRYPDATCGCEVTVTKGAPPTCSGTHDSTCYCRKETTRVAE